MNIWNYSKRQLKYKCDICWGRLFGAAPVEFLTAAVGQELGIDRAMRFPTPQR